MKKLIYITLLLTAITSCTKYDDFILDYEHTAVYFPYQELTRSFVYGEKHSIELAVSFGGRRANDANEWADYTIDDSIVDPLNVIPSEYYSLSNSNRFDIHAGSFFGVVEMEVTDEFFDAALNNDFMLPLRITSTSLDSILEGKDFMKLTLKVEAKQFGNYYHNGVTIATNADTIAYIIRYHDEEPVTQDASNWELTTWTKNQLITNGISDRRGNRDKFFISVDEDNQVSISATPGASLSVSQDGECTYDTESRMFYLKYKYVDENGYNCSATDTLIFRNRILDGVNQWDL